MPHHLFTVFYEITIEGRAHCTLKKIYFLIMTNKIEEISIQMSVSLNYLVKNL